MAVASSLLSVMSMSCASRPIEPSRRGDPGMSVEQANGALLAGVQEPYTGILKIRPYGRKLAVEVTGPRGGRVSGAYQAELTSTDARELSQALIELARLVEQG